MRYPILTSTSSRILIHLRSPSFLTPTSSCILIHLQSPILSDTNVLMYSHSSSITHPFLHQRPPVFSFIFNHPSFLTPTSSRILIQLQSPIHSDTNVLMYSHSSSITHPYWHQRPHVFSFIFSPHPFWHQRPHEFSFIFSPHSFWHQRPHVFSFIFSPHSFWHQRPHVFSFIFNHPSFPTPTSSCILIHLQSLTHSSNSFYNNLFMPNKHITKQPEYLYKWLMYIVPISMLIAIPITCQHPY